MKERVLIIDACQYTANYNNCLLDALVRRGERVVYATTVPPNVKSLVPPGVEVRYCFFYLARMLGRLASSHHFLRRVLRAIEYPINLSALIVYVLLRHIKIVHYIWIVLPTVDLLAMRFLRFLGCRVVYTAHNPFPHEFNASHLKKYSRIYRQVDHIIALTNFTRNQIVKHAKISTEKISVIPHGDFDYVLSQYPCNEALAEKLRRLAGDKRVITFLGLIRPYKGLEYFIKAFELIKRLKSNTFFLIAGSTRFANQKQLERLLSASCDPRDRYVDLSYFPVSDLKAYLAVTDVMVLPYVSGASQSANTVMAYVAGIPVISTNVGGLAEMVEDGKTGYVIAPQDPEAIADAVAKCFDGDNYEKMSHNARRAAAEQYGWEKIAEQTADIYRHLAGVEYKLDINMRWLKLLCKKAVWEVLPLPVIQLIKKQYYFKRLRCWRPENEPDLTVVQHLVKLGDHVIDIGANIGIYTKTLSELVGKEGRVYSIEPFPTTFEILRFNITKLQLGNVEPIDVAISDSKAFVTMEIPYDPSGTETHYRAHIVGNYVAESKPQKANVRATTIDSIFLEVCNKISFIKCDVEGHELACLRGAEKFLDHSKPAWLIEVSGDPDNVNSPAHHVFEILLNKGYTAWWFDGTKLRKRAAGDKSTNYFFLGDDHINFLKNRNPNLILT